MPLSLPLLIISIGGYCKPTIKPRAEVAQPHSKAKGQSKKYLPMATPSQNPTHCEQLNGFNHLRGRRKIAPREIIKAAPSAPKHTYKNIFLYFNA